MSVSDTGRNWGTIVYKESASDNWIDKLESLKIPCYISPLHCYDCTEDGEIKKPHWHVLMLLSGQKNRTAMLKLIHTFGGVGAEKVNDKQAYIYYLCHLKSIDKYVYDVNDVISLNGVTDYKEVVEDSSNRCELIREMIEWCNENTVFFSDLVDYARKEKEDWFRLLALGNHSHLVWEYLKSKNYRGRYKSVVADEATESEK